MTLVVAVLASVVCFFSLVGVAFPNILSGAARRVRVTTPLRVVAAVLRVGFGAAAVLVADQARFPLAFQIIGVLLVLTGFAVLLIPNRTVQSMLDWVIDQGSGLVRTGGLFGLLFGAFLLLALA